VKYESGVGTINVDVPISYVLMERADQELELPA